MNSGIVSRLVSPSASCGSAGWGEPSCSCVCVHDSFDEEISFSFPPGTKLSLQEPNAILIFHL